MAFGNDVAGPLVIGLDYGTDSARAILVQVDNGTIIERKTVAYPRWQAGKFQQPERSLFRQHPSDYLEVLNQLVTDLLAKLSDADRARVVGMALDTTGSTPAPVNKDGVVLAELPAYADDVDAMFFLWKDHVSHEEAAIITESLTKADVPVGANPLDFAGGYYSPEWFWAKWMYLQRRRPDLAAQTVDFVECCDFLTAHLLGLSGNNLWPRNTCTAGHKGAWGVSWGGWPDPLWLGFTEKEKQHPLFKQLPIQTEVVGTTLGELCPVYKKKWGLPGRVQIATGALDAHMGALGAGIQLRKMVKVIGTSTCDMIAASPLDMEQKTIPGIAGQAMNSIIPGEWGLEAGQSAFGDMFLWYARQLQWAQKQFSHDKMADEGTILQILNIGAEKYIGTLEQVVAVDWWNGRRSPYGNCKVQGAIQGINLGTVPEQLYVGLMEAACLGSAAILMHVEKYGVPIDEIIAVGGIAQKSPLLMQMLADITERTITVILEEQVPALGSAMAAAVGAGCYPTIQKAQIAMATKHKRIYSPNLARQSYYRKKWQQYIKLGAFIDGVNVIAPS